MKKIFYVLIGFILLNLGCGVTSTRLEVLKPAEIDIPTDIEAIAFANRSLPSNQYMQEHIIEGIFTQEPIYADRDGSVQAIRGVASKLNQSPRFSAVVLEGLNLYGTGTRNFAPPLNWNRVQKICNQFNVDALVLLEAFDSNIRLVKRQKSKTEVIDSVEVEVIEYTAILHIDIEAGWRVYDNHSRRIIDHDNIRFSKKWSAVGPSPKKAIRNLPPIRELINEAGYMSGEIYAKHISPIWVSVSREYYRKGSDELKKADKFAKGGDWQSAKAIWFDLTNSTDLKEAERATFNMILASEIDGDFQEALYWARKSIKDYNSKKASNYIRIINQRIADGKRLDQQLN